MISNSTMENKYSTSGSDGKDIVAEHTITTEDNTKIRVTERNAFDVGYQIFVWATSIDVNSNDWVNDAVVRVKEIVDTDTDSIQHKFTVELYSEVLNFDITETIDVVVWDNTSLDEEVQKGDLLYLDSVVCDTYNSDKYLFFNSQSQLQKVSKNHIQKLNSRIRSYIREHGVVSKQIRM